MYKRVLLLISVQRWEWEAWGHAQWKCWDGGGCAWTWQWFFVLGWRMGNAVVSGDQRVPWVEQSNAESLPLHHPTGHTCTIAASCVQIFLNNLEGQNQFSIGRKGCEGPSLISLSPWTRAIPSFFYRIPSPLPAWGKRRGWGSAEWVQGAWWETSRIGACCETWQSAQGLLYYTWGNLPHPRSLTLVSHIVLPSNGSWGIRVRTHFCLFAGLLLERRKGQKWVAGC